MRSILGIPHFVIYGIITALSYNPIRPENNKRSPIFNILPAKSHHRHFATITPAIAKAHVAPNEYSLNNLNSAFQWNSTSWITGLEAYIENYHLQGAI